MTPTGTTSAQITPEGQKVPGSGPTTSMKPIDDIESFWSPMEKAQAPSMLACSFHGSTAIIRAKLAPLIEATDADELMVAAAIWDHQARVRSFELLAQAMD